MTDTYDHNDPTLLVNILGRDGRLTPEAISDLRNAATFALDYDRSRGGCGQVLIDRDQPKTILALISERETLRAELELLRAVAVAADRYRHPYATGEDEDALDHAIDAWKAGT